MRCLKLVNKNGLQLEWDSRSYYMIVSFSSFMYELLFVHFI